MDKNCAAADFINYPVGLEEYLTIFKNAYPLQFGWVMSAKGLDLKTQYDLFDVLRQPFSLLFGIMTPDRAVNFIYVLFRVVEQENLKSFRHTAAAQFFRKSLKAFAAGLYFPSSRLFLLWARIFSRARL